YHFIFPGCLMAMKLTALTAISPIDGRYADKTWDLRTICSEFGLMHYRLVVEIRWLQQLAAEPSIKDVPQLSDDANAFLDQLISGFDMNEGQRVKSIEDETNHD